MPVPKSNQRAVNKYVKNNYDRINVTLPKGQKEIIKQAADEAGLSVNAFITRAIKAALGEKAPDCNVPDEDTEPLKQPV